MSEPTPTEYLELNEWFSKEECDQERIKNISLNIDQYLAFFRTNEYFSELPEELKNKGAELITRFFFGVWMSYRRFGFKYPIFKITYDTSDREDYDGIGFNDLENKYYIKMSFIKKVLDIYKKEGDCPISGMGIDKQIPAEDFFEIAGVEEAAHLMFYNEKGDLGGKPLANVDPKYDYYTSEMESRALLWKSAYVKRYFPDYYDSLKETVERVKKIRFG